MADRADNLWPGGPEPDPVAGFPPSPEELDAQLDTVACEPFAEDQVHRMAQAVRFRAIAERLKARDEAAVELLQFLRETEALKRPRPAASPLALAGAIPPPETAPLRPQPEPPGPAMGWGKRVLTWVLRHQLKAAAAVLALAFNTCFLVLLGVLAQAGFQQAAVHKQAEEREHLRADEDFHFVELVINQFCAPVPQTRMPTYVHRRDARDQEAFQKALGACERFLAHHAADPAMRRETGRVQYWMGCILLSLGKPDDARTALAQAVPPLRELADEFPDKPAYQRMLGEVHLNLATLLAEEKIFLAEVKVTPAETERAFVSSLDCFTHLTRHFPDQPNYQFQLAGAHELFGSFLGRTGRTQEAEQEFAHTQRLLAGLKHRGAGWSNQYQFWLAQSHLNLGSLHLAAGQYDQAEKSFTKAGAILTQLPTEVASVPESRDYLAAQWSELGNRLFHERRPKEARLAYDQARTLWAGLAQAFPQKPDYRNDLGGALVQLALLVREDGDLAESCRLLSEAIPHQRAALAARPEHRSYQHALRDAYLALAATQMRRDNYREAAEAASQLPQVRPDAWQEHFRAVHFLSRCLTAAEKDPRLDAAQRRELVATFNSRLRHHLEEVRRQAAGNARAANQLAWFLATCPKTELRDPAQAVRLAQNATRLDPAKGIYWNTLGVAYCRAADWNRAVEALHKSLKLRGDQADSADWFFLAMAHWQRDQEQEARKCLRLAIDWMDRHNPQDEELLRFRTEVTKLMIRPATSLTRAETSVRFGN